MHNQFKDLLPNATGYSEFSIVVSIDIRGFSSFSTTVESPEVAMFIKKVYKRMIDDYFEEIRYFKPTGDGLMIVIPYTEDDLEDKIRKTVVARLEMIEDFEYYCSGDPMITSIVPDKIGIGISRGTICYLVSGDKILDVSGKVVNLAARLTDVARPSGVVFDAVFGGWLLTDELRAKFTQKGIYVRGIAEESAVQIWYSHDYTTVEDIFLHSPVVAAWDTISDTKTLSQIKTVDAWFEYKLPDSLKDYKSIAVTVSHPAIRGGRALKGASDIIEFSDFEYQNRAGKQSVRLDFSKLSKSLIDSGVKPGWKVDVEISFQIK